MGAGYTHTKEVCKVFEIKNLNEYHDLHVQSDTLLLTVEYTIEKEWKRIYFRDTDCQIIEVLQFSLNFILKRSGSNLRN